MKKIIAMIYREIQDNSTENQPAHGRLIASNDIYNFYFQYGDYDEIHFFYESSYRETVTPFQDRMNRLYPGKIKCLPFTVMTQAFATIAYYAIIDADPGKISKLNYLRTRYHQSNCPILCVGHTISSPVFYPYLEDVLRYSQPYDVFVCASTAQRDSLEKIFEHARLENDLPITYQGQLPIIPLGVNTTKFCPVDTAQKRRLRVELNVDPDVLIFGTISRLDPSNKMEIRNLIIAFAHYLEATPARDTQLLIIGEEQSDGYIQELIDYARYREVDQYVFFIPTPQYQTIQQYYQILDVFVSLSDHVQESFGLTPIEALSAGLPCIISNWDGYKDSVIDGRTGFQVPTYWAECDHEISNKRHFPITSGGFGTLTSKYYLLTQSIVIDYDQMVQSMLTLRNAVTRAEFAQNSRQLVLDKYYWPTIISQYNDQLEAAHLLASQLPPTFDPHVAEGFYPFFKFFGNFATEIVTLSSVVTISAFAQRILRKEKPFILLPITDHFLPLQRFVDLLLKAQEPISVEALFVALEVSPAQHSNYMYAVMFMLKHDLLKLVKI